jgi:hypothetical protein
MHEQSFVLNHGLQPKESRKLFKSLQYMKFDLSGREAILLKTMVLVICMLERS